MGKAIVTAVAGSDRHGWRFWAVTGDGHLVGPHTGVRLATGVLAGQCDQHAATEVPYPGCHCGVYYMPRAEDFAASQFDWGNPGLAGAVRQGCEAGWFALSYGMAVGRVEPDPAPFDVWTPPGTVPADTTRRAQVFHEIEEQIAALPGRQREAFLMRYWEEMDVAETAAAMGCSEGSVKTHCSRAVHALSKALKAKGISL